MFRTFKRAPFPLIAIVASFLCPVELSLTVSEFRLPPHRIALLIFAPIATFKLLGSPETRVRSFDIL
ncbi:MAG: hypothetical protein AAFU50_04740, partial [Pseudomonadota bacterium]